MANIAIVIESSDLEFIDKCRQTVAFTIDGEPIIFTRLTDGKQGLGNRWEKITFEEMVKTFSVNETLTRNVAGVKVTLSDVTKYHETGRIQVLGVKSVTALLKAGVANENVNALETFVDWYECVLGNSPSLLELINEEPPATPQQTIPLNELMKGIKMDHAVDNPAKVMPLEAFELATIPSGISSKYINRKLPGDLYDFEVYDYCRSTKRNVILSGPTGPGKTMSIMAWAEARGIPCVIVSGNAAMEPSQLFGKKIIGNDGKLVWVDGPLTHIVRYGGIILFDELNFINMKIITPTYSLLDGRRCITLLENYGETIEAHPDVTIFATMNPNYLATSPLNAAFRNRFDVQIDWDYDYEVEGQLVKSKNVLDFAKKLRDEAGKGLFETPISTNMLMEFEDIAKNLNFEFAVTNFINHFSEEERSAIRVVFQVYEYNIKEDLGIAQEQILTDKLNESESNGENLTINI